MNREILFRGKSLETGKWLYGFYEDDRAEGVDFPVIVPLLIIENKPVSWAVEKTTVGQYTGLKDKNGKRIFEGDIVRASRGKDIDIDIGCICYMEKCGVWVINYDNISCNRMFDISTSTDSNVWMEVIGNIYDNPELMEV